MNQDRLLASLRTDTLAELCGLPPRRKESTVDTKDRDALVADRIRHLVADTWDKLDDENADRQLLLEDMLSRLLTVATHLDGREPGPYTESAVAARHAYPLRDRSQFGDNLAGGPVAPDFPLDDDLALAPPDQPCPYTFAHTRAFCGYSTCRER